MYTLQQLYNRIIWNFRDPRSGSTWFLYNLSVKLIRTSHFFDSINHNIFGIHDKNYYNDDFSKRKQGISDFFSNRKQESSDIYKVLNTHEYTALESISNYQNPILLRNIRRNKTEQFASLIVANLTHKYNVHSIENRNSLPKVEPITIDQNRIYSFINRVKDADRLWQIYSNQYESESVYYEDLFLGWESKIIPIKMKIENTEHINEDAKNNPLTHIPGKPIKLPYNYQEIITNYDEIDMMLKNELGDF